MTEFITGTVERAYIGAEYEGKVWSRFLDIRAIDGRLIHIFDSDLLSANLTTGETCSVIILAASVLGLRYFPTRPSVVEMAQWEGFVIDVDWQAPQGHYTSAGSTLYEWRSLALLQMTFGQLLMYRKHLGVSPHNGDFVQWDETARFDLLAVV